MENIVNTLIRNKIKEANVKYWQVAKELRISPSVFSVMLREELNSQQQKKIEEAIDRTMKKNK